MSWKRAFTIFICSVIGPLTFIHLFDSIMVNLQGMEFVLGLKLALKGSTTINIPPIGILKAYTHTGICCYKYNTAKHRFRLDKDYHKQDT